MFSWRRTRIKTKNYSQNGNGIRTTREPRRLHTVEKRKNLQSKIYTVSRKNGTKMFVVISPITLRGCRRNLVHRFLNKFATKWLNVFHFTWIMSLHYLVKLDMLIVHVLPMSGYSKKQQNLSHLNCDQIWIHLIIEYEKCCKRRCTIHASLIWNYQRRHQLTNGCRNDDMTQLGPLRSHFYRAACMQDAVLWWDFCPSVRLSVCLSVTRVNCDKTVERSVQIYIPYERTFILVFWKDRMVGGGATPSTWNFGSTDPHWNEIADFQPIIARSASAVTPSEKKFN